MSREQCSLQRFGELVTNNFLCGAVFDVNFLLFDAFSDEKYRMSTWRFFFPHKYFPFLSMRMALWLSWYTIFLFNMKPCLPRGNETSRKYQKYDCQPLWYLIRWSSLNWYHACSTFWPLHLFQVTPYHRKNPSDTDTRRIPRRSTIKWYPLTPPPVWDLFLASTWFNVTYGKSYFSHPSQDCELSWWGKPVLSWVWDLTGSRQTIYLPQEFKKIRSA